MSIDAAMTPRQAVRRMMAGMKQWTGAGTTELIVKAYLWLVCVTAPTTTFVVVGWWNPGALILFVPVSLVVTGIGAAIGGIISIPFSHGLSRALVRVRSRLIHTISHSLLAGVLAAACLALYLVMNGEDVVWTWTFVAAAPAGVAAAIARWRLDIVKPSTIPRTEKPADFADEPAEGDIHAV